MKITESQGIVRLLSTLDPGEVFEIAQPKHPNETAVFILTKEKPKDLIVTAVNLSDGGIAYFSVNAPVHLVEIECTIKRHGK